MKAYSENLPLDHLANLMKHDWNARANENAKWYINTWKMEQPDEEFYETGRRDVDVHILTDMSRLTQGRDPKSLRLLEIGCGIGRMTRHFAEIFGEVYATDVSGEMIKQARRRLRDVPNVKLFETSGIDLRMLSDDYFNIIFSAFVFQHVPSIEIVRANIYEAYRVLRPGGIFKFQVNSTVTPTFERTPKDTWTGVIFSEEEIRRVSRELDAQLISLAGIGGQYGWIMLRKRSYENEVREKFPQLVPRLEGYSCNNLDAPPCNGASTKLIRRTSLCIFQGLRD